MGTNLSGFVLHEALRFQDAVNSYPPLIKSIHDITQFREAIIEHGTSYLRIITLRINVIPLQIQYHKLLLAITFQPAASKNARILLNIIASASSPINRNVGLCIGWSVNSSPIFNNCEPIGPPGPIPTFGDTLHLKDSNHAFCNGCSFGAPPSTSPQTTDMTSAGINLVTLILGDLAAPLAIIFMAGWVLKKKFEIKNDRIVALIIGLVMIGVGFLNIGVPQFIGILSFVATIVYILLTRGNQQ